MKQYLKDFFEYNYSSNNKLLEAIHQLPSKEEASKLFSHMILAQEKWFNRIKAEQDDLQLQWMTPVISLAELASRWDRSTRSWLKLIDEKQEHELMEDVIFKRGNDGKSMAIKFTDLILQLGYHNIHHRAQINTIMSKQGITPPQTDYIFTKLREL